MHVGATEETTDDVVAGGAPAEEDAAGDDDDAEVETTGDDAADDVATDELTAGKLLELPVVPGFTVIVMAAGSLAVPVALYARTMIV